MDDTELLNIFWLEVSEHLETLNNALLQVEMKPSDADADDDEAHQAALREMNRVAHSMKGAARAVGISVIETISHYMEEVFGAAFEGKLELTPDVADTVYDSLDLIQNVADGEELPDEALATVLARLEQIIASAAVADPQSDAQQMKAVAADDGRDRGDPADGVEDAPPPTPTVQKRPPANQHPSPESLTTGSMSSIDTSTMVIRPAEEIVRVTVGKLDRLMAEVTELFVARMHGEEQQRSISELRRTLSRWQREWRSVRAAYIRLVRHLQDEEQEIGSELPILFRFLESNQRYLSEANRMLGQLAQSVAQDNMHLSMLTDQLQDDIGGMRLMPFETVAGGFQRMVRDLARDMKKQIRLEIIGAGVEIDKAVLDALKDPLMHVLRNAVDHGIEPPDAREKADKPPVGHIEIDVQQRGSEIVIAITDDGQGIDADRVRKSIVSNNLMSEADAAALNDDEVRIYVFYSGLSTNEEVTALSGRGLGMDIVRDRVESLRGRVGLQSTVGEGTTVTMSVPVSLTRIRCIMLRVGEQRFAVPSAMVTRMDKISRSEVFTAEGHDMLRVADHPVSLASLGAILNIPSSENAEDKLSFVALQATDRTVAFEVDELFAEQELVLKPLGPELARARFVSGAALLGTGDVIIVLDANDLVRRATGSTLPHRRTTISAITSMERRLRVLVIDDSITTRTLEKNILETAGFEVYVAIDGEEAWGMLPQYDFDVIISDVEMPNVDGLELTSRIRASAQFQHIPIILLTSLGKPEQREAGLRAGADAYLIKSRFDQGELLETIQSVV